MTLQQNPLRYVHRIIRLEFWTFYNWRTRHQLQTRDLTCNSTCGSLVDGCPNATGQHDSLLHRRKFIVGNWSVGIKLHCSSRCVHSAHISSRLTIWTYRSLSHAHTHPINMQQITSCLLVLDAIMSNELREQLATTSIIQHIAFLAPKGQHTLCYTCSVMMIDEWMNKWMNE